LFELTLTVRMKTGIYCVLKVCPYPSL